MMRRLKIDEYLQMENGKWKMENGKWKMRLISHRGRRGHRGVWLIDMRR
jgi:hypothetical protein